MASKKSKKSRKSTKTAASNKTSTKSKKTRKSTKAAASTKTSTKSKKPWHDGALLRRMYEKEGMSQGEIARSFGCSLVTVNKAFKAAKIKVSRGRRSRAVLAAGTRNNAKVKAVAKKLEPVVVRRITHKAVDPTPLSRIVTRIADQLDKLPPSARAAVKRGLKDLINEL